MLKSIEKSMKVPETKKCQFKSNEIYIRKCRTQNQNRKNCICPLIIGAAAATIFVTCR